MTVFKPIQSIEYYRKLLEEQAPRSGYYWFLTGLIAKHTRIWRQTNRLRAV